MIKPSCKCTINADERVSVIVPTYNRCGLILRAIDSILRQQYDHLEVIVVDDGSTDDTASVIANLSAQHPQIVYLANTHRKGPSGARNTGLEAAKGGYVAFLDSDDVWDDHHLSEGVGFLQAHPQIGVLFGNFTVADSENGGYQYNFFSKRNFPGSVDREEMMPGFWVVKGNLLEILIENNVFQVGSVILRRNMSKPVFFDESIRLSEDRDFAIRLYKEEQATFAYRTAPTFVLQRHAANLTEDANVDILLEAYLAHVYLFLRYLSRFSLTDAERTTIRNALYKKLIKISFRYRQLGQSYMACRALAASLRYGLSSRQLTEFGKIVYTGLSKGIRKKESINF